MKRGVSILGDGMRRGAFFEQQKSNVYMIVVYGAVQRSHVILVWEVNEKSN